MGRPVVSLLYLRIACSLVGTLGVIGAGDATEIVPHGNSAHCAIYGPGFAAVAGSDTCIRIGGRVRVEAGNGRTSLNTGWADNGYVPAAADDIPAQRQRLRLNDINTKPIDPLAR